MNHWLVRAFAAVAACVLSSVAAAQVTTARVTGGQVQGVAANGVVAFKGIPFAAPPVGELRWKKPQSAASWQGVRAADKFAPSCMQDPMMLQVQQAPPGTSEDCLYLNVWTAAKSGSGARRRSVDSLEGRQMTAIQPAAPTTASTRTWTSRSHTCPW